MKYILSAMAAITLAALTSATAFSSESYVLHVRNKSGDHVKVQVDRLKCVSFGHLTRANLAPGREALDKFEASSEANCPTAAFTLDFYDHSIRGRHASIVFHRRTGTAWSHVISLDGLVVEVHGWDVAIVPQR